MADHYLDQYEWFLRADDDVYVNGTKLQQILRHLNSSKFFYIGQGGGGKKEHGGMVGMGLQVPYCMGGPGVVFSQAALAALKPHLLTTCTENFYSTQEDTEIGRCVHNITGQSCFGDRHVVSVCQS